MNKINNKKKISSNQNDYIEKTDYGRNLYYQNSDLFKNNYKTFSFITHMKCCNVSAIQLNYNKIF